MGCIRWPGSNDCHSKTYDEHIRTQEANAQAAHAAYVQGVTQQAAQNRIAAPPAPAAPAPPPVPAPAPVWSPDSGYNNDVDFAQRNHDRQIGDIGQDEKTTKFGYGFDDPTNPFSQVNELKKTFLANGARIGTVMASSGHLYGGANQRAMAANGTNESKANASLRAAYDAALMALKRRGNEADTALEQAKLQAYTNSYGRQFGG